MSTNYFLRSLICFERANDDFCISITNNRIDAASKIVATPNKLKATDGMLIYLKNIVKRLAINAS